MYKVTLISLMAILLSASLTACSTSLSNEPDNTNFSDPKGVPWVESREYDVYVYLFPGGTTTNAKPLHYGRYALSDKVNGEVIDAGRQKWTTNYKGAAFSDGTLKLTFHENGSLKEVQITSQPSAVEKLQALTEGLDITNEIEKKELERLEREKKIKEIREALEANE